MGAAEELLGEIVHSPRTNVPENLRFGQGRDQVHGGAPKEAQKCKDFVVLNLIAVEISIKKIKMTLTKITINKIPYNITNFHIKGWNFYVVLLG